MLMGCCSTCGFVWDVMTGDCPACRAVFENNLQRRVPTERPSFRVPYEGPERRRSPEVRDEIPKMPKGSVAQIYELRRLFRL